MAEINNNITAPTTVPAAAMNSIAPDTALANNAINTAQDNLAAARVPPEGLFTNKTDENVVNTKAVDMRLPFLTRQAQAGVSLMELLTAVPLLFSSLISQAETIIDEEKDHPGNLMISFLTTSFKSLSSIFRWGFHQVVPKASDPNDVTINKRPFALDNILGRVSQPVFVKEATSFIFAMRRALFSFIPNVLTVPAEEHDPTKPVGSTASSFMTDIFKASSSFLSPFRIVSSLITGAFALSSHGLGALFAYTGDQKPFDFTKFTSRISDCLMPVTTNLNSLYKVARAYKDSWSSNMHLGLTFDRYNINFTHMIQGVLGSITSIPYLVGALLKVRNILLEPDSKYPEEYALANLARDGIGALSSETVALTGLNLISAQTLAYNSITKLLEYIKDYSNKSITRLMNFSPSRFMKSEFFSEAFDLLHPIQSALMLLPNAFVGMSDAYIQDNGTRSFRWLDRLVGVNSMILSAPNYLIYLCKTRFPQMVLKFYEMKQNKANLEGRHYNAFNEFNKLIQRTSQIKLPGFAYIAKILEGLDVHHDDFHDAINLKLKFEKLEKAAVKHEQSVKASELVTAMRIGMRHVIGTGSPIFFAQRDEVTGFTAEEQSKDDVYKSIGRFSQLMKGIPVVGWGLAYFVDMFRSMYKVTPVEKRKKLAIQGKQAASPAAA